MESVENFQVNEEIKTYRSQFDDFCFYTNNKAPKLIVLSSRNIADDIDIAKMVSQYLLSTSYITFDSIIYTN